MSSQKNQPQHEHAIVERLQRILADTYVLYVKTQNFHWNVTDQRFYSLHKFFESIYEELEEAVDLIAERIRVYNSRSPGSMQRMLELTSLKESEDVEDADVMLLVLYQDHLTVCSHLREAITLCDDNDDLGGSDLLSGLLRAREKTAWMLRSHFVQPPEL